MHLGGWGNGLSEVARARQSIKIPAQAAVASILGLPLVSYPRDDPQGRLLTSGVEAALFLSSPAGAKHGYGVGMPTVVRTVAFGSIPVEVGLRIEQVRDADDLPVPLRLSLPETRFRVSPESDVEGNFRTDAAITGQVRVRLTALSVDGVDVRLEDCVSPPIELDLHGNPRWRNDPLSDPALQPFPVGTTASATWLAERGIGWVNGGGISGHVDIPPFSNCRNRAGEDLSPLLTGAVSGPGNAVTIGWASISGDHPCGTLRPNTSILGPRGPFLGDPSDCDPDFGPPVLDYPERTD